MGKRDKFVLTTKLIEGIDGRKMSKSFNNCIYLDDAPSDMFGKLMAIKDDLVRTYFECMTNLPMADVDSALSGHPKDAKMRLAREIVTMYHGADAAHKAEQDWTTTFSEGGVPEDAPTVAAGKLRDIVKDISTSELRRLVEQGAVTSMTRGVKIENIDADISNDTIRIGKHRFLKVN
jgi:tyrosyl-tRNA synthetase